MLRLRHTLGERERDMRVGTYINTAVFIDISLIPSQIITEIFVASKTRFDGFTFLFIMHNLKSFCHKFDTSLKHEDCMKLVGKISRKFYKYVYYR